MYKIRVFKLKLVESSTKSVKVEKVNSAEAAAQIFATYLEGEDREHFVLLMLDLKKRIIGIHTVSIGSLTQSIVHPREVFKAAILANAHAIIVGHNHPTGDTTPSIADLDVTRELVSAGELLRIPVLDHIIVGHDGKYLSLLDEGLMKPLGASDSISALQLKKEMAELIESQTLEAEEQHASKKPKKKKP
jgi:DNA repair protein RadC